MATGGPPATAVPPHLPVAPTAAAAHGAGVPSSTFAAPPTAVAGGGSDGTSVLDQFKLRQLYHRVCEQALPASYAPFVMPALLPGDTDAGVLDGARSEGGLAALFQGAPPHGYEHRRFEKWALEEGFGLTGTRRVPGLPPPRPRFQTQAEREAEAAMAATARAKAEADHRAAKAAKSRQKKKEQMAMGLEAKLVDRYMQKALRGMLSKLEALSWKPEWTLNSGNPFRQHLTKAALRNTLPTYFDVITRPMDLVRMRSNLKRGEYKDFASFQTDVYQMVANAQSFNRPGDPVHRMAGELRQHYDTVVFPAGFQEFHQLVNTERKRRYDQAAAQEALMAAHQKALRS